MHCVNDDGFYINPNEKGKTADGVLSRGAALRMRKTQDAQARCLRYLETAIEGTRAVGGVLTRGGSDLNANKAIAATSCSSLGPQSGCVVELAEHEHFLLLWEALLLALHREVQRRLAGLGARVRVGAPLE